MGCGEGRRYFLLCCKHVSHLSVTYQSQKLFLGRNYKNKNKIWGASSEDFFDLYLAFERPDEKPAAINTKTSMDFGGLWVRFFVHPFLRRLWDRLPIFLHLVPSEYQPMNDSICTAINNDTWCETQANGAFWLFHFFSGTGVKGNMNILCFSDANYSRKNAAAVGIVLPHNSGTVAFDGIGVKGPIHGSYPLLLQLIVIERKHNGVH